MYRPLAIILTAGTLAIAGETAWIITNVVKENSSQEASIAIPREKEGAEFLSAHSPVSSIAPGNIEANHTSQASTPLPTIADSHSTAHLPAPNNDASSFSSTSSVRTVARSSLSSIASYASSAVPTPEYQSRTSGTMPVEPISQSVTAPRTRASGGSSPTAYSVAPPATASAVTSVSAPEVTTTALDPSAPGNSITAAGGDQVSVDGVTDSSGGSDISLAVTPASQDIASLQEDTPAIIHDQELFRAKWGWSAYDQALRVSKGFSQ